MSKNIVSDETRLEDGVMTRTRILKSGAVIKNEVRPPVQRSPGYDWEELKKDIDLIKGALNI